MTDLGSGSRLSPKRVDRELLEKLLAVVFVRSYLC